VHSVLGVQALHFAIVLEKDKVDKKPLCARDLDNVLVEDIEQVVEAFSELVVDIEFHQVLVDFPYASMVALVEKVPYEALVFRLEPSKPDLIPYFRVRESLCHYMPYRLEARSSSETEMKFLLKVILLSGLSRNLSREFC